MIEILRSTQISNKNHTLLKNSKMCELEKGTLCSIEVFDKNLHFFKSVQIF